MRQAFRTLLTGVVILLGVSGAESQTPASPESYGEYFSDAAPDLGQVTVPPGARELIVAKVCVVSGPFRLGNRYNPYPFGTVGAEIQIVEVLKGETVPGKRLHVGFLPADAAGKFTYPSTPRQLKLQYFIVAYVDQNNARKLAARPSSQERYEEWYKERWDYLERGRTGTQDERINACPKV